MAGTTFEAVMPHRRTHVLADVEKGGAAEVERAISRCPRCAPRLVAHPVARAGRRLPPRAELVSARGGRRSNAATMLNQSKTALPGEIDAAVRDDRLPPLQRRVPRALYEEQPISSAGRLEPAGVPPARGLRLAISPFNFTAIGANLTTSPALMGNTVVWKPASTQALAAWYTMRLLEEAGLPPGVINLVFGPGAELGDAALSSPELAGVHFTGSTGVFHSIWRTIGGGIDRYRNYHAHRR
jgi:1-pyrroline-5-carboxylate dehydrogenase